MLYTGRGDDGTTKFFGCDQRFSKSSLVAEALGSLDELNSFLGLCKNRLSLTVGNGKSVVDLLETVQQDLFIIQAQVAGGDKELGSERVLWQEQILAAIEKDLPPITKFVVPGATEESAWLDVVRTLSRKTERRVVAVKEEAVVKIGEESLRYLNRLSSLLYGLARLAAKKKGAAELNPHY